MMAIREELENVQKKLKLQSKRCRQLVSEYTRKLQEKDQLYFNEKTLRDNQLAKVLKALLIFEARLKQEQKLISHQLSEKDFLISKQNNDIKRLLDNQYCKNCNKYYTLPVTNLESFDSSSEYVATEPDYQSSNLESLDSSTENYAASSERNYPKSHNEDYEPTGNKHIFQKHWYGSQEFRKVSHKKCAGAYFQVLKLRNESPSSNDDNTSADYDNLDSLPAESVSDKISEVSENIDNMLNKTGSLSSRNSDSSANVSSSECDKTVINTVVTKFEDTGKLTSASDQKHVNTRAEKNDLDNKLTDTMPLFEGGGDTNDNWYASASDQEDEDHRDVYRNNPVLECMNQILLQNINDINSPPKTPNIERKTNKSNKRVKFSDKDDTNLSEEHVSKNNSHDYYETPIQKIPNFYETPQSIYSNDYEQILSKSSEYSTDSSKPTIIQVQQPDSKENHHYIEMEQSPDQESTSACIKINRKNKILRAPPALPPKPPNLVSKCKIQTIPKQRPTESNSSGDLEPDYCSISELNLPQNKVCVKKISVVAEIHSPTSHEIKNKRNTSPTTEREIIRKSEDEIPNLLVKKCVEKFNIQLAKQAPVKTESTLKSSPKKKNDIQIPKLPQVSEIIIPDDPEDTEEENISQDNYIRNNTQILQSKSREPRKSILIGSSVSSLINGFNNNQLIDEIKKKHERLKSEPLKMFSSFDNLQNLDKHLPKSPDEKSEHPCFENFELSQNFEEFKLDDCEIEEYDVEEELRREDQAKIQQDPVKDIDIQKKQPQKLNGKLQATMVDYIRATDSKLSNSNQSSLDLLKKQLELRRNKNSLEKFTSGERKRLSTQPTYEHFLECTGLSSKSLLTSSRISSHTQMINPKEAKLKSKERATSNIFESEPQLRNPNGHHAKHRETKIKYWSEPFV